MSSTFLFLEECHDAASDVSDTIHVVGEHGGLEANRLVPNAQLFAYPLEGLIERGHAVGVMKIAANSPDHFDLVARSSLGV